MTEFVELPNEIFDVPIKIVNQEKLELDINDFLNNDIIIINSGTATGKTRIVGKHSKQLKEDKNYILSIVNLISLAREQEKTFYEESKVEFKNYLDGVNIFNDNDGVICINSLFKLSTIEDYNIENKILYIDEVNDLIKSLTHNDGLDKVLNLLYTFLIKLIKNCKKIILSDATIDQNIFNLLSSRKTKNKTLLIKNEVKKFNNIKANKYNDENMFIDKLRECIKNKKYFLFGCDGCNKISKIYLKLIDEFKDQKELFKIYTREQFEKVENADIEFKNKYVFYSPSIKTGVSFVLKDIKQPQFMYLTKSPQIDPESFYQMSCRTRNMLELNLYLSDIKPKQMKHKTLKELEKNYKKMIKYNNRLLGLCSSRNEDDEITIVDNTFFKIFCYAEYKNEIFDTGYTRHYLNLLKKDGFKIEEIGEIKKLDIEENKILDMTLEIFNENKFDEFIEIYYEPKTEEELESLNKKYLTFNKRIQILNIPTKEEANQYKKFITDEYLLNHYFQAINLFKSKDYIKQKLIEKNKESFKVKIKNGTFNKIQILEYFETHYKIERFNLDFSNIDETIEINKDFKKLYENLFPKRTSKSFNTKNNLRKIYINIIKNICGDDLPIIFNKKVKNKQTKKSEINYFLNIDLMKEIITLVKFNNPQLKDYNLELIEKLTTFKPEPKPIKSNNLYCDNDEDNFYNSYLLNKTMKHTINITAKDDYEPFKFNNSENNDI